MKTRLIRWLVPGMLAALTGPGAAHAQGRYLTKTGRVSFFSTSLIEDIEAVNTQAAALLDLGSGQVAFAVPIKGFTFKRTLMQEHFNENYLESDKFPKATFSGKLLNFDAASLATAGPHAVQVEGELTMHGVTHRVSTTASLEQKETQLLAFASFSVAPADYAIEVPLLVRDHIAKVVTIRVALGCVPASAAPAAGAPNAAARPGSN